MTARGGDDNNFREEVEEAGGKKEEEEEKVVRRYCAQPFEKDVGTLPSSGNCGKCLNAVRFVILFLNSRWQCNPHIYSDCAPQEGKN